MAEGRAEGPPGFGALVAGAAVQVRTRFDGAWAGGFAVDEVVDGAPGAQRYRLRRLVDGAVLPVLFSADDVTLVAPPRALR